MMIIYLALAATLAVQPSNSPSKTAEGEEETGTLGTATYADLEAGTGYSTNPVSTLGGRSGRLFGRVAVRASHSRQTVRSNSMLFGYAENVTYSGKYGSQQLLQVNAHHDAQANERVRLFGDVNVSLDRGGQLGTRFVGVPINPDLTSLVSLPGLPVGSEIVTTNGRQFRLGGQIGVNMSLGERDWLTLRSGADKVYFKNSGLARDYSSLFGSAAYDRQLNERTTVGGLLTVANTNYAGQGDARVITPQITARLSLSQNTTVSGAVGLSLASVNDGMTKRRSVGVALNSTICRRGANDQLCASIARSEAGATIAGAVRSIGADLSYSRRLDSNQSIQLSAAVSRYSTIDNFATGLSQDGAYARVAAGYTRKLGERLSSGVNISARKLSQSGDDPRADLSGSAFIRYRLGQNQ